MTAARILVVDDEDSILQFVSYNLRKEGYEVTCAKDGDEALAYAAADRFDLVILDIMLPGADGYEVCRKLRAIGDVPVLFLSARDTELDKVVGLELGGDDYLSKPFGIRELQARVKALLRRSAGKGTGVGTVEGTPIDAAGIHLDEAAHEATYDGTLIDLTPREFELLACLIRHAGKVLSREQLLREAWGWQYLVETKTVDTHVKRLRDKLTQAGADPAIVETVRGYGYRISA
ncbi:MAG: response regulator transcription factor [Actinobacteria bacterium]|nr:MAG: response regulator transcription factor [Actinomycetota bacterium]